MWEYKRVCFWIGYPDTDKINKLGKENWEIVTYTEKYQGAEYKITVLLKRRKGIEK